MTKRYDLVTNYLCGQSVEEMTQDANGEWVRYEDVQAELDRLPRLREALGGVLVKPAAEVGPACMYVAVPPTIAMDDAFRESYCQGWRHALAAIRAALETPTP